MLCIMFNFTTYYLWKYTASGKAIVILNLLRIAGGSRAAYILACYLKHGYSHPANKS